MPSWNGHKGRCKKYQEWVESQTGYKATSTPTKNRKFPSAAMLYRRDYANASKKEQVQAFKDPVFKEWYEKLETKLSAELRAMEDLELEFLRFNVSHPEKVKLDKSTWVY